MKMGFKLLEEFRGECREWYKYRMDRHCYPAWQKIYDVLLNRHGRDAVLRHAIKIKHILDCAECEIQDSYGISVYLP